MRGEIERLFDVAFDIMERVHHASGVLHTNAWGSEEHRQKLQQSVRRGIEPLPDLINELDVTLDSLSGQLEESYSALGWCDFGDRDPYALGTVLTLSKEFVAWGNQFANALDDQDATSIKSPATKSLIQLGKRCPYSLELAAKIDRRLWLEKSQMLRDHVSGKMRAGNIDDCNQDSSGPAERYTQSPENLAPALQGVTLSDAAMFFEDGDMSAATGLVKRYIDNKKYNPAILGKDPHDGRRKLSEIKEVIKFFEKNMGSLSAEERRELRAHLRNLQRSPE